MEIEVEDDEVLEILKEDIKAALKNSKNGKAREPDQISVEILKCVNDDTLELLLDLFNTIYKTRTILRQWLLSTFCAIPKTADAKDCNEYRTIYLISHVLDVFLIQNWCGYQRGAICDECTNTEVYGCECWCTHLLYRLLKSFR